MIELLERRMLMAAPVSQPSLYVWNGVVHQEGTKKADHMTVGMNPDHFRVDVTMNGVTTSFDPMFLIGVVMDGKGGKDVLEVDETNGPMTLPVTLVGGAARDTLVPGSADAMLIPGNANSGVLV